MCRTGMLNQYAQDRSTATTSCKAIARSEFRGCADYVKTEKFRKGVERFVRLEKARSESDGKPLFSCESVIKSQSGVNDALVWCFKAKATGKKIFR